MGMVKIKKTSPNVGEDVKQPEESSYITGASVKWHKHFGKLFCSF